MSSVKEFADIAGFLTHLAAVELVIKKSEHHALGKACMVIEKDAKAQFGTYQGQVGPFDAWAPLAESTLKHHESMGVGDTPLLITGKLRESISHEVHGNEAAVGSTEDIMVYQELGTPKIPPRPVLGPAAFKNRDKIQKILGESLMSVFEYGAEGAFVKLEE